MSPDYLHGYTPEEQARLVAQAEFWRDRLILPGLAYRAGERLLEIGCAAGASLGVLGHAFPGLELAGIDLEPAQIEFARRHLAELDLAADLRVGDAAALPWPDARFDHVYSMWLFEHLKDARPVLAEVRRVLAPGGTLVGIETDYTTFRTHPLSADFDYLARAQRDLFAARGNPLAGRMLGVLFRRAGFADVRSSPVGFHHFADGESDALRHYAEYVAAFLEPQIDPAVADLGCDRARLQRGLAFLRSLPDQPEGALTQIVYKARARRPPE